MPRHYHRVFSPWSLRRKRMARLALALVAGVVLCGVGVALAARALNASGAKANPASPPIPAPPILQGKSKVDRLHPRLALQPEADHARRLLGQRFTATGRELATLVGTLKLGAQQFVVRVNRSQQDDGESLSLGLNGALPTLTWNSRDGARASGSPATGETLALIERFVLDSPDQFILAQLRGASYYTVARNVRPTGVGSANTYTGPLWNLVRISEPVNSTLAKPQSLWRLYYVNTATGLVDKVLSQEQSGTVTADIASWTTVGGEQVPAHITWTRNSQIVMEFTLNSASYGPKP